MAGRKGGLGKGLDALFADNSVEENSTASAVKLKISDIEPNRAQPRKTFNDVSLSELAESIAQHGVIQPLLVRPLPDGGYQLVAGERRWRAARIAGVSEVPVVIREMNDKESMELALIENLQREDLNPIEEAEGMQQLIDSYGFTQENVAKRVGRSRPAVANILRLLNLPESVRQKVKDGKISAGHAKALLAFSDKDKMEKAAEMIINQDLTVRELEKLAKKEESEPKRAEKKPKRRDAYYDEVELALTQALGRKVKVNNGKDKGTLEIEYYGKDDLAELANIFADE